MDHYQYPLLVVLIILALQFNRGIFSNAEFAEYPSNISLTESEMEAVFRCRHQSTEAFIIWLVNGSSSGEFTDIVTGSISDNGNIVSTMTIPAKSEYNGTEIVCEAFFVNGSPPESTYPVLLTIIAVSDSLTTTLPRMITMINNFIETPFPPVVVVTTEQRYVYICNNSATDRITWRVNGSVLWTEIFPQSFEDSIIHFPDSSRLYTLTIGGRPEHNTTTIQCVASFRDGSNPEVTSVALFLIQGTLNTVINLNRTDKLLLWTAPFSLNLTGIDPDIVYCVEVYNITCGRSLLISECDVIETSYTNDTLLPGYIYEYTVTPRSNVEGASNGTSLTIKERFHTLIRSEIGYTLTMINTTTELYLRNITNNDAHIVARINLDIDLKRTNVIIIVPTIYLIYLEALDNLTDCNGFTVATESLTKKSTRSVMLEIIPLPIRRLWNVMFFAHYCDNHPLTPKIEIGTHDVYNISIISSHPGQFGIIITGNILDESLSVGALIIVYSLTNDTNILCKFAPRLSEKKQINLSIIELPNDGYGVSVFVVEENELPFHRVAVSPRFVVINATVLLAQERLKTEQSMTYILYSVLVTVTGVCITCTFLDSSTTDCVAVVHQRISQLSSSGLMNIESSHKFNRSGDTAYGCIEGINLEQYQVGVIKGLYQQTKKSPEVCVWCIYGAGPGIVLIGSVVGIAVILTAICAMMKVKVKREMDSSGVFQSRKSSYSKSNNANDIIELKKCGAYEVIQLAKQRVIMKENPVYGEVGTSHDS